MSHPACGIMSVHNIPIRIVLNLEPRTIILVVDDPTAQDTPPHAPNILPPLLGQVVMPHQLRVKVSHFKRGVVDVRRAYIGPLLVREEGVVVGALVARSRYIKVMTSL